MKKPSHIVLTKAGTFPPLLPGEIHIWRARMLSKTSAKENLYSLLTNEECNRAAGFHFEHDRDCHILAHGYLRLLLGQYVQKNPEELILCQEEHGKPFLKSHPIEFSLSHAGDVAVFAFALEEAIGVDVEVMRVIPEAGDIIQRLFSSREQWIFFLCPRKNKVKKFLKFWTRGEALIKAVGYGFGDRVGAISRGEITWEGKSWKIKSFTPFPGYIGAIAASRFPEEISCRDVDDLILLKDHKIT